MVSWYKKEEDSHVVPPGSIGAGQGCIYSLALSVAPRRSPGREQTVNKIILDTPGDRLYKGGHQTHTTHTRIRQWH